MNRPWITFLACAVLALVIAAAAWLAWPTGRAFSFLNDRRPAYQIEVPMTLEDFKAGKSSKAATVNWNRTLEALSRGIGSGGYAYSVPVSSALETFRYGERTVPNISVVDAMGAYREARGLSLLAGREPNPNTPEIALSEGVAGQLSERPLELVGQSIIHNEKFGGETLTVVGIVRPSLWRSDFEDPDEGGYRKIDPGKPGLDTLTLSLYQRIAPRFTVVFAQTPTPQVLSWLERYVARSLPRFRLSDVQAFGQSSPENQAIRERIAQRSSALPLLAALLALSGLLALCALTLAELLRRRSLLGVELALGANRGRMLAELLARSVLPGGLGALLGTLAAPALPEMLPGILVGSPPLEVQMLAFGLPTLALAALTLLVGWGVLRETPLNLLRGARPGQFVRPLLGLLTVALTLSLAGVLSALGVGERLEAQTLRVRSDFGRILALATSADGDFRKGDDGPNVTTRKLTAEDAAWLSEQPGVALAAIGERINGELQVRGKPYFANRMTTGDPALLDILGLRLLEGRVGGCLLTPQVAREYGLKVGHTFELTSSKTYLPCVVSGLFAEPDALQRFVVLDSPQVIVPTQVGLVGVQGPLPGMEKVTPAYAGGPLKTTRLLLRLERDSSAALLADLKGRVQTRFPGLSFSLRPYAPSIALLLERLELQSRLFLALATAAGLLGLFGLLGGFLAYLDATRYRTALDRTFGQTLAHLRLGWARGGLALGLCAALGGLTVATLLTPALYNAFSLDAPTGMARDLLPSAQLALPGPLALGLTLLCTLALSLTLLLLGSAWFRRQSLTALLGAGS